MRKSRQLVNRWLNDVEHPPEEKSLQDIARLGKVSLAWLRYGEGNPLDQDERGQVDPVILQTALYDIYAIVGRALGLDVSEPITSEEGMFDSSPEIMAMLSNEEEFLQTNRKWSESLSWERTAIEGKRWEDVADPADLKTSRLAFTISRDQNAVVEFDGRVRTPAGDFKNMRWRVESESSDRLKVTGRETTEHRTGLQVIADEQDK